MSAFDRPNLISCSFDASTEQTLLPLIGGGAAVVISDDSFVNWPLNFGIKSCSGGATIY